MELFYQQFIVVILIVAFNFAVMCFRYINWSWNFTAWFRIIAPPILFSILHPALAMLLVDTVLDSIEPNISRLNIGYHLRDKQLDLWGHTVGFVAMWFYHELAPYRILLTLLFISRTMGVLGFLQTHNKRYLGLIPNMFSTLYILLPILDKIPSGKYWSKRIRRYVIVGVIILKIWVEYVHHASKIKQRLLQMRQCVKYICPGKTTMYQNTGTYPIDHNRTQEPAPNFKSG
jgi:hypothetical protein